MGNWQADVKGVFDKVMNFVKESYTFSSGTYSANQVKAGLCKFAHETNLLLEGSDPIRNAERVDILSHADIYDGMGHDELFDLIEKLEFHMQKKFPADTPAKGNASERAYVKADYIADAISEMSNATVEDYAHKFDRMIGVYTPPQLVTEKHL